MRSDDVVEVLGLLHFVPQLVPGALQHLRHTQNADAHFTKALWELHCPFMKNQIVTAAHVR